MEGREGRGNAKEGRGDAKQGRGDVQSATKMGGSEGASPLRLHARG